MNSAWNLMMALATGGTWPLFPTKTEHQTKEGITMTTQDLTQELATQDPATQNQDAAAIDSAAPSTDGETAPAGVTVLSESPVSVAAETAIAESLEPVDWRQYTSGLAERAAAVASKVAAEKAAHSAEIESLRETIANLQRQLQVAADEKAELRGSLDGLTADVGRVTAKAQVAQDEAEALRAALEQEKEQHAKAVLAGEEKSAAISKQLESVAADLGGELETANASIREKDAELNDLRSKLEQHQAQSAEDVRTAKAETTAAYLRTEALSGELSKAADALTEKDAELLGLRGELAAARGELFDLRNALTAQQAAAQKYEGEANAALALAEEAANNLGAARTMYAEAAAELAAARKIQEEQAEALKVLNETLNNLLSAMESEA